MRMEIPVCVVYGEQDRILPDAVRAVRAFAGFFVLVLVAFFLAMLGSTIAVTGDER